MLAIFAAIESVVQFLSAGGIKMDFDSVYDYLTGSGDAILLKDWEGGGIVKDDDKWVIYLPITLDNDDNVEKEDWSWISEWSEFRDSFYPDPMSNVRVKSLKRFAGKVVIG